MYTDAHGYKSIYGCNEFIELSRRKSTYLEMHSRIQDALSSPPAQSDVSRLIVSGSLDSLMVSALAPDRQEVRGWGVSSVD